MTNFRNIPTSSQWITFPVSSQEKMTINWEDNYHNYVHTYYVAKCYFGILEGLEPPNGSLVSTKLEVPAPIYIKGKTKLTVLGETKIYIAAEFIEEEYAESPSDLGHFHLRDIASIAGRDGKWVTMKLNGAFCYGQNGSADRLRRYIVYHPSIGPGIRRPNIHQHRFTDTEISNAIRKSFQGATEDMPEKYKLLGAALSQLIKGIHKKGKAALGDSLRVFLDDDQLSGVNQSYPVPQFLRNEADLRTRFARIQNEEANQAREKPRIQKRDPLLTSPSNEVPFVPAIPSVQQEEPKAEETNIPERVTEKTLKEREMQDYERVVEEVFRLLAELEEKENQKSNNPQQVSHAGRPRPIVPIKGTRNIQDLKGDLITGNIGKKGRKSTDPIAFLADMAKEAENKAEKEA